MTIALFYYDGFVEFEIVFACLLLHQKHKIISIALEKREYISEEQQRFCIDQAIEEIDPTSIDLLIIPGGNPATLADNKELKRFVETLVLKNKKVAGICGGASLLAALGILKGKNCTGDSSGVNPTSQEGQYYAGANISTKHVVVDGNIITAQGQAYIEFAVELSRQMKLYENPDEYDEAIRWCKNIR
jgi:putative intracellular protease/amidase